MNLLGKCVAASLLGAVFCGCALISVEENADGFVAFDGNAAQEAPSDYFILRFECPNGTFEKGWNKGLVRWNFVEIRQLKSGSTTLMDGVLTKSSNVVEPRNWHKLIRSGARNVRVKFVNEDYCLAEDGRRDVPDGFVALFNGKDLSGWKGVTSEEHFEQPNVRRKASPEKRLEMQKKADALMNEHWSVRDGVLYFDGLPGGNSLATVGEYGDIEMIVDWRLLRTCGDSGFYLRGSPQVQIWDPRNRWAGQGSGCIWNNVKAFSGTTSCEDRQIGDWNTCRMRLVGDMVTVWLNGVKVVDNVKYENLWEPGEPLPSVGQVELQCHGDPVEFRNVFIRELPRSDGSFDE